MPDQRARLMISTTTHPYWMEQTFLCTATYVHGFGMRDSSIHQGQAQGDDRIGFTTCAGNTSNHLSEVWGIIRVATLHNLKQAALLSTLIK